MDQTPVPPHLIASFGDIKRLEAHLDRIEAAVGTVISLVRLSLKMETHMSKALDDLEAEVSQTDTVIESVLKLIDELAVKIAEAGTDPTRLQAVTTDLMNRRTALAAAVAANTPADAETTAPVETPAPPVDGTGQSA
jgi:septal ring factor EnvC (AmiA/AmiB activator)